MFLFELFFNSFFIIFPELFLVFVVIGLFPFLYFCSFTDDTRSYNLFFYVFFSFFFIFLFLLFNVQFNTDVAFFGFNGYIIIDSIRIYVKMFICFILFLFVQFSFYWGTDEIVKIIEFYYLIILATLGLFIFISSSNFFLSYCAIELQSFCFYCLCSINRKSALSSEASLRYFILGSFASAIFLFGCSFLYGNMNSLDFFALSNIVHYNFFFNDFSFFILFGYLCIFCGLFFKLAVIPFHFWIADVYEGIPYIVLSFFATAPKVGFLFFLSYCLLFLFQSVYNVMFNIFFFCYLFSLVIGIFLSFYQFKIKRLIAYSAIAHIGYMLIALSTGLVSGFVSLFFYLFVYIFISLGLFICLLSFRHHRSFYKVRKIVDFFFFLRSNFVLSVCIALFFLSFAGIPPLAGFFSKFFVFLSLIDADYYILSFFVASCSIFGVVYYIRLYALIFLMIFRWLHFFFQ